MESSVKEPNCKDERGGRVKTEEVGLDNLEGLLLLFQDRLDEATVRAVVEEFHGDVNSAKEVLDDLARGRSEMKTDTKP